jgi:hypothetical protein
MKILLPVDGSELSWRPCFAIRMVLAGLRRRVLARRSRASLYELLVAHDPEVIDRVSG